MPRLADFRGAHYGEAIVVCGLGASINSFHNPRRFRTIGVNDIGRGFTPDYLFVMDAPQSFGPERFQFIRNSKAKYIFTDHDLGLERANIVRFPIRSSPAPRFDDPDVLYLIGRPPTSPFLALCLAAHMGAKAIGMVGVDFTDGHFFSSDGTHKLADKLAGIDKRFYALGSALLQRGVKIFNLSAESRVTAFPRLTPDEFYAISKSDLCRCWSRPARRVCLRTASAASENLAAIAKLINSRTTVSCRLIAPGSPDIDTGSFPEIEERVLADAPVKIDCDRVRFPPVAPGDPRFLDTWNRRLRPLLFGRAASLHTNPATRPLSVTVIVSQEEATGEEVAETVRSLWPDLLASDELVVVGSNPEKGPTPPWLRNSPRVRYTRQAPAESLIAARNRAAGESAKNILIFTDANVQTPRHWVGPLLSAFRNREVAAAGPGIVDMYERASKGYGMKWTNAQLNTAWLPKTGDQPYAVPLLPGVFLAVRRSVFRRLGGFDSGMTGAGGDDTELCFRLWTAGYECRVAPGLEVLWMNPYSQGAIPTNKYWGDLLGNLLRLVTVHFGPKRTAAFVRECASDPAFPAACARLLASDATARRRHHEEMRKHAARWFFERFANV